MSYTHPTADEIAARRAQLAPFDGWNERAFCQVVAWMGIPASYLDLGSGTGAMVNCARKLGSEAYGVDLINGPEHWFLHADLTQPVKIDHSVKDGSVMNVPLNFNDPLYAHRIPVAFDLITCLEVAEHLPLDAHETLVDTIARHLRPAPNDHEPSGYVIFSAAPPGQGGEHHVGCRPAHEWRGMFHERGISYRHDLTTQMCHLFAYVTGPASHWLGSNLMAFDRGQA